MFKFSDVIHPQDVRHTAWSEIIFTQHIEKKKTRFKH